LRFAAARVAAAIARPSSVPSIGSDGCDMLLLLLLLPLVLDALQLLVLARADAVG
jgi:hypothetical protein